jgi:uncharacterized protein YprB with RNaseH-like and TPR domain
MASDDLRKRLEALNGGPLASTPADIASPTRRAKSPAVYSATLVASAPPRDRAARLALSESLARLAGGEPRALADGREYHHVETCLASSGNLAPERTQEICTILESASFRDHLRRPTSATAEEALFLDLETLGLHGEPLFLIGMATVSTDRAATCIQLLARDLDEEATILDRCLSYLRRAKLLLTYNGKSFDVPMLKSRIERHGLRMPRIAAHVDLLMEARIRYRAQFRDCKLQTMERHLCGRTRTGDIPGAQIPAVYKTCVSDGNAAPLATILLHNRLDLATTAELVAHFWRDNG